MTGCAKPHTRYFFAVKFPFIGEFQLCYAPKRLPLEGVAQLTDKSEFD